MKDIMTHWAIMLSHLLMRYNKALGMKDNNSIVGTSGLPAKQGKKFLGHFIEIFLYKATIQIPWLCYYLETITSSGSTNVQRLLHIFQCSEYTFLFRLK